MKGKIKRIAEGMLFVSDEPLLDQLGLDDDAEVEFSTAGPSLVITPVRDQQLVEILDEMDEQYGRRVSAPDALRNGGACLRYRLPPFQRLETRCR